MINYSASQAARTRSTSSLQQRAAAQIELRRRGITGGIQWPEHYVNAATGKQYQPHNDDEAVFVLDDVPRSALLKGGEGAGKSVAGIVKNLNRLRHGCSGAMTSPDLEHFKKSLWPEFRRWCPWDCVVKEHQRMSAETWEPHQAFSIVFYTEASGYATLQCGGMNNPESWEGPNLNFWHIDEARRFRTAAALKVVMGRARLLGPGSIPPQVYLSTTPRKHWLYEYFGPLKDNDPLADFKRNSFVGTIPVHLNAANLDPGYLEQRGHVLTASEKRVLMDAEWEDEEDTEKFLKLIWWDNCHQTMPTLSANEPLILALDAAKGGVGTTTDPDCFAVIGVTRSPHNREHVAVRYVGLWEPPKGGLLDYEPIETEIRRLCREFAVVTVVYDPYQLHDMGTRLKKEGVAHFKEFQQGKPRLLADKGLLDLILSQRIIHDGDAQLRSHIDNANIKKSGEGIRIVKRASSLKVDLTVALSMASWECLRLNL